MNRYSTEISTGQTTKSKVDYSTLLSKGDSSLIATIHKQRAKTKGKSLSKLKETLMLNQSASENKLSIKPYIASTSLINLDRDELDLKDSNKVINPATKGKMFKPSYIVTKTPN